MDVLLNGLSISAKGELQPPCCKMGKTLSLRCHFNWTHCQFLVTAFQCIYIALLDIIKLRNIFDTFKNMQPTEYDTNVIHKLSTGPHKNKSDI